MFCFDLETAGLESTAAILSLGMVYYDPTLPLNYNQLLKDSIFIKFDLNDQIKNYGRTTTKSTLDWWRKQCKAAQVMSLIPRSTDVLAMDGVEQLRKWFFSKPDAKSDIIWARGTLDQPVFESLVRALDVDPYVNYNQWRDVRTAIDCFYPHAKNGYISVDETKCQEFDWYKVVKHDPIHDAAYDICQLFAGKTQ